MKLDHRLTNILVGFICFAIAEAAGPFLALLARNSVIMEGTNLQTWQYITQRSSHAHFALFGLAQVLIGLTMPISQVSRKVKTIQTFLLSLGTVAMGPLMFYHSQSNPSPEFSFFDYFLGALLSLHLLAVISHIWGLALKNDR